MKRILLFLIIVVNFLVYSTLGLAFMTWKIEKIADSISDSNQVTSIALNGNNNPAISYYDLLGDRYLRYAQQNSDGTWSYSIADSNTNSGDYSSLQFNPSTGFPEISYLGNLYSGPIVLKFAQYNGATWNFIILATGPNDVGARDTSLAYNPNTSLPAIAHGKAQWPGFMEFNGISWEADSVPGGTIYGIELKYRANGNPAIAYRSSAGLVFAERDTDWNASIIDSADMHSTGDYQTVGLEFDSNGLPHIAYVGGDGRLKYASFDGISWEIQDLGLDCMRVDLDLDTNDNPFIAYQRGNDIYFGYKDGDNWIFDHFAPDGYSMSNLLIDGLGNAHISFMRQDSEVYTDRNLYYAKGIPPPIEPLVSCVSTAEELQAALAQAANNRRDDIIKIRQGTYLKDHGFRYISDEAHNLTVEGGYIHHQCKKRIDYPATTILDANQEGGRVLTLNSSGVFANFIVNGLTLIGGLYDSGSDEIASGLLIETDGNVDLKNSVIYDNITDRGKGSVVISAGGIVNIINNLIDANSALNMNGTGGVYINGDEVNVVDNMITRNTGGYADTLGRFRGSIVTFINNNISNNEWGISVGGESVNISKNKIVDNGGQGLGVGGSNVLIEGNTISGNDASGFGEPGASFVGGISVYSDQIVTMIN